MTRSVALSLIAATALACWSTFARADDDPIPPPLDPGPGFEGLLPAPVLPPSYRRDQDTIPYGVRSVANTPVLHLGQSFRPSQSSIDWVAFVFQNSVQPSDPDPPGPGYLQVGLYSGINTSNGQLSGLLGTTNEVAIESQTTGWLVFEFPESISVTPGTQYYLHVRQTGGYQSWVGIRHHNVYSNGSAFGYLYDTVFNNPPQNLNWGGNDLHFATGIIVPQLSGDYNNDGAVDAADYTVWRNHLGDVNETNLNNNGDGDDVGPSDYAMWKQHYGMTNGGAGRGGLSQSSVPEPTTVLLMLGAIIAVTSRGMVGNSAR